MSDDQPTRKMPILPPPDDQTIVTTERGGATVTTPGTIVRVRPPIWLIIVLVACGLISAGAGLLVVENGQDDGTREARGTRAQLAQQYDACVARRSGSRSDRDGATADIELLRVMMANSSSPQIRAAAQVRLKVAEDQFTNAVSSLKRGKSCAEAYPNAPQIKKPAE